MNPVVAEDVRRILAEPLPWEALDGATVLVTGAAGFLAAYLVETLLALNDASDRGIRVLALVRDEARARVRFGHHLGRADLILRVGDASAPFEEVGPVDYVLHAASQASPKYYGVDPVGTLLPNAVGTYHLLELARAKGSRGFLYFSSGEVYGVLDPSDIPTAEHQMGRLDPAAVRSCYGEGKRVGETLCVAYAHQHGVPTRIVRPFHTYGPGMALDDGRVFADFVADLVHGRDIVMKSEGRAIRPFCYLADATRGFFTALLAGADGQAYNVGNPAAEVSILSLAETLVGLFPEKRLAVVRKEREPGTEYLESPIPRNCPRIDKLGALGWRPEVGIAEGFGRTVRSFG